MSPGLRYLNGELEGSHSFQNQSTPPNMCSFRPHPLPVHFHFLSSHPYGGPHCNFGKVFFALLEPLLSCCSGLYLFGGCGIMALRLKLLYLLCRQMRIRDGMVFCLVLQLLGRFMQS